MRSRKQMIVFGSLAAGLLSCTGSGTPEQEAPKEKAIPSRMVSTPARTKAEIERQLDSIAAVMRGASFSLVHGPVYGALRQGGQDVYEVDLRAGVSYWITGVCDGECSDLNLVLADPQGQEMDVDRKPGDAPTVVLEPERTGSYRLSILMASCSVRECRYGVQVLGLP